MTKNQIDDSFVNFVILYACALMGQLTPTIVCDRHVAFKVKTH